MQLSLISTKKLGPFIFGLDLDPESGETLKLASFPIGRLRLSNIYNLNPDFSHTFAMSALPSQITLIQMNQCQILVVQISKSPNSMTLSDQQPEEEKWGTEDVKIPNPTVDLDYGEILPREIWLWIGKRLESRLDVSRFRSVCRTWRSILPPPFRFPLRVPPPPDLSSLHDDDDIISYYIAEVTFYAANEMIVLFEEDYRGGKFSASAFVHKDQIPDLKFELPPVSQISNFSFLCNAYHLHSAVPQCINKQKIADKYDFFANSDVLKIAILCSDGAAEFNPNYPRLRDLKVVAHLINRKLAVLHLGGGAMINNWKTGFCNIVFDDIVRYRGQLYGVDKGGSAFVMDYNSLHMTQVAASLSNEQIVQAKGFPGSRKLLHLMVVSGHLYMFVHEPKNVLAPRLYKLSLRLGKWVEADQDLPDQVFIQTLHCNFPIPMDLFLNPPTPRFCSWPKYEFVQVAVGSKNEYQYPPSWQSRGRFCDVPSLFYRKVSNESLA